MASTNVCLLTVLLFERLFESVGKLGISQARHSQSPNHAYCHL